MSLGSKQFVVDSHLHYLSRHLSLSRSLLETSDSIDQTEIVDVVKFIASLLSNVASCHTCVVHRRTLSVLPRKGGQNASDQ